MIEQQLKRHGEAFSPKLRDGAITMPRLADDVKTIIEQTSEGIETLDEQLKTTNKIISDHLDDTNNPHGVTKNLLGLGNVENKSSATIRSEITKANVTSALGFTPANSTHSHSISDITNLSERLSKIEARISFIEGKMLSVSDWSDIASISVTTSNTGDIDDCYNFISGSLTTVWGQTIVVKRVNESGGASWGHEQESSMAAYLDYNGNIYLRYHDTDENGNDISHPTESIEIGLASKDETYTYTRNAPITTDFD